MSTMGTGMDIRHYIRLSLCIQDCHEYQNPWMLKLLIQNSVVYAYNLCTVGCHHLKVISSELLSYLGMMLRTVVKMSFANGQNFKQYVMLLLSLFYFCFSEKIAEGEV